MTLNVAPRDKIAKDFGRWTLRYVSYKRYQDDLSLPICR